MRFACIRNCKIRSALVNGTGSEGRFGKSGAKGDSLVELNAKTL